MRKSGNSVFESVQPMRMFPTVVWKAQVKPRRRSRLNTSIRAKLADLRRDAVALNRGQAWQSGHTLHELEVLRELVETIKAATVAALKYTRVGYTDFQITGCWANVNAPGAVHRPHGHPNNYLSGVYYVQVPKGGDTVNFHDPRIQTAILRPPLQELTADNADQVVMAIRAGTLLLFPSWFQHSVEANHGKRERISISFNIMFSAYAENLSKPMW